jgi:hypothetical protein
MLRIVFITEVHKMILKNGVSTEEVKIYELYLQRWAKEADLIWSRFKIYFGFNSIIFVVIGFILKPYIEETPRDITFIPNFIWLVLLFLSILGCICSIAWFLINRSGRLWQLVIDKALIAIENDIFENPKEKALYKKINENYDFGSEWWQVWKRLDVMDINNYLSITYTIVFVVLIVCSCIQL